MLLNSCDRFFPGSEWIAAAILQWCSHLLGIELSRCVLGVWVPCIFLLEIPERLSTYNRVRMTTQAAKVAFCFKHLYMLMEHAPHTFPVKGWLPSISFKLGMQFIISSRCPVCVCVCMHVCVYTLADAREFSELSYGVLWLPTLACQCDFHS